MSVTPGTERSAPTILKRALRHCRWQFAGAGLFSLFVNVLTLTTALYMMQIFDRVLTSHSLETLLYLSLIVGLALVFQGVLEASRALVLSRAAAWIEGVVGPESFMRGLEVRLRGYRFGMESLRDIAMCRDFLSGPAMLMLYDLPWVPIYLVFAFLLHPVIGWVSLVGALILFGLAALNDWLTSRYLQRAASEALGLQRRTEAISRNAEVIDSMGMMPAVTRQWERDGSSAATDRQRAMDTAGILLAVSRFLRVAIQAACQGVGAYLALQNEITGGAMVAGSIIMGRALAPMEQMIATWKQLIAARQSYTRLKHHLSQPRLRPAGIPLPDPRGCLAVEQVSYGFPGSRSALIKGMTFRLEPGESLAVLGPSAAGKTTLVRLLIGITEPAIGAVRLDGANVFRWPREDLGRHLGYLPQDVELFEGTVFANIARFNEAEPAEVVAAAQLAGCHDMILRLPNGYETDIGEGGTFLSGGQKQLVALARALFRSPRLVVLDEPNANMDLEGERALMQALRALKARAATVILVTHQLRLVQSVDKMLIMRDGAIEIFGPREEVLRHPVKPVSRPGSGTSSVTLMPHASNLAEQGAP